MVCAESFGPPKSNRPKASAIALFIISNFVTGTQCSPIFVSSFVGAGAVLPSGRFIPDLTGRIPGGRADHCLCRGHSGAVPLCPLPHQQEGGTPSGQPGA